MVLLSDCSGIPHLPRLPPTPLPPLLQVPSAKGDSSTAVVFSPSALVRDSSRNKFIFKIKH